MNSSSRRMLLLSRTEKYPAPGTWWVRGVVAAVTALCAEGDELVTGLERLEYDLALSVCRQMQGAVVLVLDAEQAGRLAQIKQDYRDILPERVTWVFEADGQRERKISALAERATLLHVRPNGNMAAALAELAARSVPVDSRFTCEPSKREFRTLDFPNAPLNPAAQHGAGEWLTHYTRAAEGAWPDESYAEYLNWLACGQHDESHDGHATLRHILSNGVLYGSGTLMPTKRYMVSFTACAPAEALELMRYRRGLARVTFEPYGISIRREALETLGVRPVRYLSEPDLKQLSPDERVYAQPQQEWAREQEWRVDGDLKLSALPKDAVRIWVPTEREVRTIEAEIGLTVHSIWK